MKEKSLEGCNDKNCPFHGSLRTRGRSFVGTVISTKMQGTALVEWDRRKYLSKYERYEKRRSKVKAHNPYCISAKEGDLAKIMECRPLSKTKNFVIVEVLGKEKGFKERMEGRAEAKVEVKKKEEDTNEKIEKEKTQVEGNATSKS
jgi:small subunit ribosomal protein S17